VAYGAVPGVIHASAGVMNARFDRLAAGLGQASRYATTTTLRRAVMK
jgi:hypothetical protein